MIPICPNCNHRAYRKRKPGVSSYLWDGLYYCNYCGFEWHKPDPDREAARQRASEIMSAQHAAEPDASPQGVEPDTNTGAASAG